MSEYYYIDETNYNPFKYYNTAMIRVSSHNTHCNEQMKASHYFYITFSDNTFSHLKDSCELSNYKSLQSQLRSVEVFITDWKENELIKDCYLRRRNELANAYNYFTGLSKEGFKNFLIRFLKFKILNPVLPAKPQAWELAAV